jgi:NodT family efflux transporter outer membrane factor (OMF) lipoprotein
MKNFLILLLIIVLTGCASYKSMMNSSAIDMPSSYSSLENKPAPPIGRWWEQFKDTKLNYLMEEAFIHNLDIAQAYERLEQSREILIKTDSSRGLTVNLEGSARRARQSVLSRSFTSNAYSLSVAAQYELDIWGKLKSGTSAAKFDVMASEQDLNALYISISAQLADLYYLAVEQQAQLDLSDQTIDSFQDTLDRVERRYRSGLVPAIDVYQSRQNLASAKAQRPLFESTLSTSLNAISVLIGRFPDRKIIHTAKEINNAKEFMTGVPSQLLMRRPDINAALLRLTASNERIGTAISDRFPSFNLSGNYGGSSEKLRDILDSPNIIWNILMQIAQPILDAGNRKAEVNRTKAVFRENLVLYHKTVLNAFREVEDSLSKISTSEERIKMLYETVSASEDALRLALDSYMQGLSDYLPVLTEQLRHFTAKSNLLSSKRQLISDRIQLARSLGGEWANEIIKQYAKNKISGDQTK